MEGNPVIGEAVSYIRELFRENAGGHDAEHTLRVWRTAARLAAEEPGCDTFVAELAALLHDADDYKLFQTKNNANARAFMASHGVPEETAERVCAVVNAVSFSKNRDRTPDTPEGRVVQDADRLDAMGAVGIARTFAFGGEHGRPMEDSIRHFYEKLLLLKERMNTEAGKRMAEKRHAVLEEFLREYREETGL